MFPDARANDQVIEKLRNAMVEQENIMETQDKLMNDREAEIESLSKGKSRLWLISEAVHFL